MRLIDADEYAKEMKQRQDAVSASIEHPIADRYYTDKEHWEGVMLAFVEAKLTLDKMPTVDAVPVVHGRWETDLTEQNEFWGHYCNRCSTYLPYGRDLRPNYCPECGAKMDLEDEQ